MKSSSNKKIIDFGFNPSESQHHFLVNILPKEVIIAERFGYTPNDSLAELNYKIGTQNSDIRVILPRIKWNLIAEHIKVEFNRRLKLLGLPNAKWGNNRNYVMRLLGKELTLLAWAIEEADPSLIGVAITNWNGLRPEERWWLYTMTNAATGHAIYDRNIGWRKAVRFALTENPVIGRHQNLLDNFDNSPLFALEDPEEKKWAKAPHKNI